MLRASLRLRAQAFSVRSALPRPLFVRASSSESGAAPGAAPGAGASAKPRRAAAGDDGAAGGGWTTAALAAAAAAAAAGAGAWWWLRAGGAGGGDGDGEGLASLREAAGGAAALGGGDPTPADLAAALGPDLYNGQAIVLLLAMDDLLLRRDWHPRFGWRVELRAGARAFFRRLAEAPGCAVTLWGDESSNTSLDVVGKMALEFGFQVPFTQLHLGSEHCFAALDNGDGDGDSDGHDGRPATGRREAGGGSGGLDDDGLIARLLSRADAALRRTQARAPAPRAKERHIEFFSRDQATILLVDTNPLSARINPHNTLIVKCVARPPARGGGRPTRAARTTTAHHRHVPRPPLSPAQELEGG